MVNRMTSIATATVLALALLVAPADARPVKNTVIGTVNGKHIKWKGRYVSFTASDSGVIAIGGQPGRPGRIIRTIGFACPVLLTGATFPLTPDPMYCNGSYTETRVSRHPTIKSWLAVQNVNVTYATFDGTVVTGTFSGVYNPVSGSTEPVTVEGQFRGKVNQGK